MKTVTTVCALVIFATLATAIRAQEEDEFDLPLSTLTVIVDTLRIRDLPSTEGSEVVGMLHLGDTVPYAEMEGDWARIKAPDGTVGWACVVLGGETFMVENIYIFFTGTLTDAAGDPVAGAEVELVGTGKSYVTDEEGWFDDYEVPKGTWNLRVTVGDRSALLEDTIALGYEYYEKTCTFTLDSEYRLTVNVEEADGIAKPNIYIYPVEETEVTVRLAFPAGGGMTVSDPPYGEGWTVTVTPDGTINGERTFLFYEAWSGGASSARKAGWCPGGTWRPFSGKTWPPPASTRPKSRTSASSGSRGWTTTPSSPSTPSTTRFTKEWSASRSSRSPGPSSGWPTPSRGWTRILT